MSKPMHRNDVFRSFLVEDAEFAGEFDFPKIESSQIIPKKLIPFSEAMNPNCHDYDCHVIFYEDDYRFERIWSNPNKYKDKLAEFAGAISPDFSTCTDFPVALKIWNTYRDRALGFWMQKHLNMHVIPNVRVEELTKDWALDGLPHESLIAICARACIKDRDRRKIFCSGLRIACNELNPTGIIWYGSEAFDCTEYPKSLGIPIYPFEGRGRGLIPGSKRGF